MILCTRVGADTCMTHYISLGEYVVFYIVTLLWIFFTVILCIYTIFCEGGDLQTHTQWNRRHPFGMTNQIQKIATSTFMVMQHHMLYIRSNTSQRPYYILMD